MLCRLPLFKVSLVTSTLGVFSLYPRVKIAHVCACEIETCSSIPVSTYRLGNVLLNINLVTNHTSLLEKITI